MNPLLPTKTKLPARAKELTEPAHVYTSQWQWHSNTAIPVPKGELRSDSGDWANATILRLSCFNKENIDFSSFFDSVTTGWDIRIQDSGDASIWDHWSVSAEPVKQNEWIDLPVTYIEGGTLPPVNNHAALISLSSAEPQPPEPPPEPPEPPYVTGGPAYPDHPSDANADIVGVGGYGLSILDYFAAYVITGLVARSDLSLDELKIDGAKHAYWIAAVMVQLRNQLLIDPTPVPVTPPPEPPPFPVVPSSLAGSRLAPSSESAETIVRVTNAPMEEP